MALTIRKRCDRCGRTADVRPRVRRCHVRKFGPGSYCCWGKLSRVVEPTPPKKEKKPMPEKPKLRPQEIAAAKLVDVRHKIAELTRGLARIAKRLRAYEKKAAYFARRASMTDAEIAAKKERREDHRANRRPKRRALKLPKRGRTLGATSLDAAREFDTLASVDPSLDVRNPQEG